MDYPLGPRQIGRALYFALDHAPLRLPVKLLGLWDEPMPRRYRHGRAQRYFLLGRWATRVCDIKEKAPTRGVSKVQARGGRNRPVKFIQQARDTLVPAKPNLFTTVRLRGHRTVRPYGLRQLLSFDRGEFVYKP